MSRFNSTRWVLTCLLLAWVGMPSTAMADAGSPDAFTSALARGPVYAALAALAGGFLVSLTPCVYPMIAVTVSVFGARQTKSRGEGALLSLMFVLGITAMFVPLGVAAGLSGTMFGSVLQNQWVVVGIALLFLAMAAAMFGVFEFGLPSGLTNRLAQMGGFGYKGAFTLGLVCGLIAAPCTGPVLTGILTWIAQTKSAPLGAAAMTAFSFGLGAPFFVVGTFAVQLPKSGRWMIYVKSLLGIVLIVVALYFLSSAFPGLASFASPSSTFLALTLGASVLGILLGAVHRDFTDPDWTSKLLKGTGVALTSVGICLAILGATKASGTLAWQTTELATARIKAVAENRPLLVDFTAAWCGACKELEKHTFSDPKVAEEASRFLAVRVDATHDDDPKVEETLGSLKVVGLPTVVLFDSTGKEVLRFRDFVPPQEFLAALTSVH